MGTIRFSSSLELITSLSEVTGYKSGLALNRREIFKHLHDKSEDLIGPDDAVVRVRAEEYDELVRILLYRVGNIPTPDLIFPGIRLYHRYKSDPLALALYEKVHQLFLEVFPQCATVAEAQGGPIDITPFVEEAGRRLGGEAARVALELAEDIELSSHQSPWSDFRRVD